MEGEVAKKARSSVYRKIQRIGFGIACFLVAWVIIAGTISIFLKSEQLNHVVIYISLMSHGCPV
jgi:hypothetical protein